MKGSVREDRLELGRQAMRRHAWEKARDLLVEADREGELDAEGLRQMGKALEWCRDIGGALDAFERSYAGFANAGDRQNAAKVALMLRHLCTNILRDGAAARGWLQRAERLLETEPECVQHGHLWRAQGRRAFNEGDAAEGERLLRRAIELGQRLGDANLVALSMASLGLGLQENGRVEEAFACLDEASAAAVGGELGPWATGVVYCNTIGAYRDAGEFGLGAEWTQTAGRWCRRESITGFSGICRVHRAEFLRLRGALAEAEHEARVASGELDGNIPSWAGEAYYEIGQIRLRTGDLVGAEEAFKRAHELGRDPQPGAALLLAARGDQAAALRSLQTSEADAILDEMRLLAAKVELACSLGDLTVAAAAMRRGEELARERTGLGLQVLAMQMRGHLELAQDDPAAVRTLRGALRNWNEIDAPYEAAQLRLALADALRRQQDEAGARRECEAALATFERLGAGPDAAIAKRMLSAAGDAPRRPARSTTKALLFSDVVGSTQLVEAIGDQAWTELLAWLDAALRTCFADHGGKEVDHAGDGFFVAFDDAMAAISCAVSIQRKLVDHRRQHGFAPRLRIGIHAASVSESGDGYRGRGVHEASRIAALANADEILASRDSVPPGVLTSDPREVRLKGISQPFDVVTVRWAG